MIAKYLVQVAEEKGATYIAHGCTGKGNDQVRIEVSVAALNPDLQIIAPARIWGWTREEEIEWALANGIPIPVTVDSPYSIDVNIWGRSIECGVLEDPWTEPLKIYTNGLVHQKKHLMKQQPLKLVLKTEYPSY